MSAFSLRPEIHTGREGVSSSDKHKGDAASAHAAHTTSSVCCCGVAGLHSSSLATHPGAWLPRWHPAAVPAPPPRPPPPPRPQQPRPRPQQPAAVEVAEAAGVQAQWSLAGVQLGGRKQAREQQAALCKGQLAALPLPCTPDMPGSRHPIQQLALALIPAPGRPAGQRARAGTSPAHMPQTSAEAERCGCAGRQHGQAAAATQAYKQAIAQHTPSA